MGPRSMTTAFGDLIRERRHTLTLTADQLAQRMRAHGYAVDIPALEDGHPVPRGHGFLNALAAALEWRVGTLRVARDFPAADPDPIVQLHDGDEATMIRAELVDLQELQQVLLRWTDELTHRAYVLRSSPPADMSTPPFNA